MAKNDGGMVTNRRHFYSFKINQNAFTQNFPQNPPCPYNPGKPLFLRIRAVRHNNAFCNGRPAPDFYRRSFRNSESIRHGDVAFCKACPALNFRLSIAPKLRVYTARRCCLSQGYPGIKFPAIDRPETPTVRHYNVTIIKATPALKYQSS